MSWPAIAFRQGDAEIADEVDVIYALKRDWKDERVELEVLDICPASARHPVEITG